MASASFALDDLADADVTFVLAGSTSRGAEYRVADLPLSTPKTLEFQYNVGNPGSKGNDHLITTIRETVINEDTSVSSTAQLKLDLSVPRDEAWTTAMSKDLLAHLADLLTDARLTNIANAIVP